MRYSSSDIELLRRGLRRAEEERRQRVDARLERARPLARRAAALLREEFGATRVVLYGSLLRPDDFHLRSDVDLAAWGVRHYFRAVASLLDLDPEIEVNVIEFEDASPGLQETIRREGVEL